VFGGDYLGKLMLTLVQELSELKNDLLALCQRGVSPARKGGLGRSDSGSDVSLIG
jgi:hypothetical protein